MLKPIALLSVLGISGCVLVPNGEAVRVLSLFDGEIVVQAPDGYCIDPATSRPSDGFAAMAGCALVSSDAVMPSKDAWITVQTGAPGTAAVAGNEATLRSLLATASGVALLSARGQPTDITVRSLMSRDQVVIVRFIDSAAAPFPGLANDEWRAFLDLHDRLVTVTVRGFARAPLQPDDGLALLEQAVYSLISINSSSSGG